MQIARRLCVTALLVGVATAAFGSHHEPHDPAAPADEPAPRGQVARSAFTTAIEDREPVDEVTSLTPDHEQVVFFTELTGLAGQTVSHRWEQGGAVMAEVVFDVGAQRWRVWSTKRLPAASPGEWTVSTVDGEGRVLDSKSLRIVEVPAASATPAAAASPR